MKTVNFMFLIASIALLAAGCGDGERIHLLSGEAMGTTYRIKTVTRADAAMPEIQSMLDDLSRELSTWRRDSWITKFNDAPAGATLEMPGSARHLLKWSLKYHEQTDGRFDPTIGALIRVWGFGAWRGEWAGEPTLKEVAAAREASGFQHLRIDGDRVTKLHDGLMLDFSAIAKGYAVDLIGGILHKAGHADFVIEFGGDILAHGNRPGGIGWTVGGPSLAEPVVLRNQAMATSGSDFKFRGEHSHVIDPHRARPVRVGRPVSVIATNCTEADALATAKMVKDGD